MFFSVAIAQLPLPESFQASIPESGLSMFPAPITPNIGSSDNMISVPSIPIVSTNQFMPDTSLFTSETPPVKLDLLSWDSTIAQEQSSYMDPESGMELATLGANSCNSVSTTSGMKRRRRPCGPPGTSVVHQSSHLPDWASQFLREKDPRRGTTQRKNPKGGLSPERPPVLSPEEVVRRDEIVRKDTAWRNEKLELPEDPVWKSPPTLKASCRKAFPDHREVPLCCLGPAEISTLPIGLKKRAELIGQDIQNCKGFLDFRPFCTEPGSTHYCCYHLDQDSPCPWGWTGLDCVTIT